MPKEKNYKRNKTSRVKSKTQARSSVNDDYVKPDETGLKGRNDIGWYTKYPALVKANSSIIFNNIYGDTLHDTEFKNITQPTGSSSDYYSNVDNYRTAVPGGFIFRFRPATGAKGLAADAINVAAKNFYAYVRHANSGSVNYESSDFMQYLMMTTSLVANLEELKRDLRLCLTYKSNNRYAFIRVLGAKGYSVAQIQAMIKNRASYIGQLNNIIAQANTFKVPGDFKLFDKLVWLSASIWKDDKLDKCSYYMTVNDGYWHYDWANSQLQWVQWAGQTWEQRLDALANEILNVLSYEDVGIMIGDVLKAYGSDSCWFTQPMGIDDMQDAYYDEEAIIELRNSTILDQGANNVPTMELRQNPGATQFLYEVQPMIENTLTVIGNYSLLDDVAGRIFGVIGDSTMGYLFFGNANALDDNWCPGEDRAGELILDPILQIGTDEPSNDEVILASRFSETIAYRVYELHNTNNSCAAYAVYDNPSDVVFISAEFFYNDQAITSGIIGNATTKVSSVATNTFYATDGNNFTSTDSYFLTLPAVMREVSGCPLFRTFFMDTDSNNDTAMTRTYHGLNVLPVKQDWLKRMHDACRLSLYSIPMFKLLEGSK